MLALRIGASPHVAARLWLSAGNHQLARIRAAGCGHQTVASALIEQAGLRRGTKPVAANRGKEAEACQLGSLDDAIDGATSE
jgi:hypothetical protein